MEIGFDLKYFLKIINFPKVGNREYHVRKGAKYERSPSG